MSERKSKEPRMPLLLPVDCASLHVIQSDFHVPLTRRFSNCHVPAQTGSLPWLVESALFASYVTHKKDWKQSSPRQVAEWF
jgi:hypothetical protein